MAIQTICGCQCHAGPYYACDITGGCGSTGCGRNTRPGTILTANPDIRQQQPALGNAARPKLAPASPPTPPEPGRCFSGPRCKAFDRTTGHPYPSTAPLCPTCLDVATRDITALIYDYLDLAQLHQASMSQAINEKTGGSKEKTMLLVASVEALQAEIVHVTTTWEDILRDLGRLSPAPTRARAGNHVQRAVAIITPRVERLSKIPATAVYRTGCEDPLEDMAGWEAVHHLQALHGRARATLGRTTRSFYIPGDCWSCNAHPVEGLDGPLARSEPRYEGDPMQVYCTRCPAVRPYDDYETFQRTLIWPGAVTDTLVRTTP